MPTQAAPTSATACPARSHGSSAPTCSAAGSTRPSKSSAQSKSGLASRGCGASRYERGSARGVAQGTRRQSQGQPPRRIMAAMGRQEIDTSKTCSVCGETKPLAEFGRSARGAGGRRSQCKQCNAATVKSQYVPRVHPPEQVTCPHCGQEFTRIRTKGALRIYCSRKCTFAAGE